MKKKKNPIRKLYDKNKVIVCSSIMEMEFKPDLQINEDSIDLRLHPRALKRNKVSEIDCLSTSFNGQFEEIQLPIEGYVLEPGELLYCQTLEKIKLNSKQHIGFIIAKQRVSAYGISVLSDQFKSPLELAWNFPLFICNHTESNVRIYPFMFIAQLLLIQYPYGEPYDKEGVFYKISNNVFQTLTSKEHDHIMQQHAKWKGIQNIGEYNYENSDRAALTKIEEISNKRNKFLSFLSDHKKAFKNVGVLVPPSILALIAILTNQDLNYGVSIGFVIALAVAIIAIMYGSDE